jgi:hypothetical protein
MYLIFLLFTFITSNALELDYNNVNPTELDYKNINPINKLKENICNFDAICIKNYNDFISKLYKEISKSKAEEVSEGVSKEEISTSEPVKFEKIKSESEDLLSYNSKEFNDNYLSEDKTINSEENISSSTTERITENTTSNTESPTINTSESTTKNTTKSNIISTIDSITVRTIDSTTKNIIDSTTESTIDSTTKNTIDSTTESITENTVNNTNKEIIDGNNLMFMVDMLKKIFLQDNNSNQTTAIQQFIKKIMNSLDEDALYKCNFINVKHCKIIDGIIYTFISVSAICIFGLLIYMIHSLYKCLSIYNNFKEAKKVFLDLESKV